MSTLASWKADAIRLQTENVNLAKEVERLRVDAERWKKCKALAKTAPGITTAISRVYLSLDTTMHYTNTPAAALTKAIDDAAIDSAKGEKE